MTIQECQKKAHENALNKGFWEGSQNISEKLMLIVSELGEACEALRDGNKTAFPAEFLELTEKDFDSKEPADLFKVVIKNHMADELADVIIRTCDLAEFMGYDLETHVRLKMRYNETRPRLHGKAF